MIDASDDECIAIAMLHGAEPTFIASRDLWILGDDWYTDSHDIERAEHIKHGQGAGFMTREALARAYCEYYRLLEPHNEDRDHL